jgi:hypothetical protein
MHWALDRAAQADVLASHSHHAGHGLLCEMVCWMGGRHIEWPPERIFSGPELVELDRAAIGLAVELKKLMQLVDMNRAEALLASSRKALRDRETAVENLQSLIAQGDNHAELDLQSLLATDEPYCGHNFLAHVQDYMWELMTGGKVTMTHDDVEDVIRATCHTDPVFDSQLRDIILAGYSLYRADNADSLLDRMADWGHAQDKLLQACAFTRICKGFVQTLAYMELNPLRIEPMHKSAEEPPTKRAKR